MMHETTGAALTGDATSLGRSGLWRAPPFVGPAVAGRAAAGHPAIARHVRSLVALLMLAGLALRLFHVGMDAYWRNELFSIYWTQHSYRFLLTTGMFTETNPPLHFVLLKLWTGLFGTGAVAARMLSVVASVACIPLTYRLGKRLGSASAGLLAAALVAASPVQIYFADEARGYALLPMLVSLALLGLCEFLRGSSLLPAEDAAPRWSGLVLYAGACVALIYTHAISVFIVFSIATAMLLLMLDAGLGWRRIRVFLVANAVVAALGAPAMAAIAWQAGSANIAWMPRFDLAQLIVTARYLLMGPMVPENLDHARLPAMLLTELGLASFAAIGLFAVARAVIRDRLAMALLLLFPVLFIALVSGVSLLRPVLIPRVTLWTTVPISLAAGFVLVSHARLGLRLLAMLPLIGCMAIGLWNNVISPSEHKPDWPAMLADIGPDRADMLVAGPHAGPLGVVFYGHGRAAPPLRQWRPDPDAPVTVTDRLETQHSGAVPIGTAALAARIAAGGHPALFLDDGDTKLIDGTVSRLPRFAGARVHRYPGLTVFQW